MTRSGVVVGGKEHAKVLKDAKASSYFYFVYPLKISSRADKREMHGFFEKPV